MTFAAFVKFLRDPKMLIDKLDEMGEDAREQLAGAFESDFNRRQMCYALLSRAIVNFPYVEERRVVVEAIKSANAAF